MQLSTDCHCATIWVQLVVVHSLIVSAPDCPGVAEVRDFFVNGGLMKVAIMVDGAFFLKRAPHFWGKQSPEELAKILCAYCQAHVHQCDYDAELYRIFFYDCPPAKISIHHPITKKVIDYSKSENAKWRLQFHEELKKKRKLALRLGRVDESNPTWTISGDIVKKLCSGKITKDDLTENDVILNQRQKGVDMRIGVDIASVSFKKQADQIILIAGDSDFVPAAKLARREGIDFVLDSMWLNIKDDLFEHIDGWHSQVYKPTPGKLNGKIKRHEYKREKNRPQKLVSKEMPKDLFDNM